MTSTTISRTIEWDMGHRLQDHESLCFNPHGHRYKAELVIQGPVNEREGDPERGMVTDFGQLKRVLKDMVNYLDHSFMVEKNDIFAGTLAQFAKHAKELTGREVRVIEVDFAPTAEKIAEYIFLRMKQRTAGVIQVTVWETPSCKAMVSERLHVKEVMS
jgi:6-pyruvoyltetrahydropterin/6-carboxytetrahydropterin synthase